MSNEEHAGGWSRYVMASACVHPAAVSHSQTGKSPDGQPREIQITLGIEHDGTLTITGHPRPPAQPANTVLLRIAMTTTEAERLRDLLIWALADLPATAPPPGWTG